jgi:hypothetical protein
LSWALPTSAAELLELAKTYPFEAPCGSYLFRAGAAETLGAGGRDDALFSGRTPVIAHGSNRAPGHLKRKFGAAAEIPVSRAWLADYDVVYSAHVTQYGAIGANLQHTPGARVEIFVTWLDAAQLERMHATELGQKRYRYGRLEAIDLALEAGPAAGIDTAAVYLSNQGCLALGEAPLGLAAIPAESRPHGALHQEQALGLVRDRHRPERPLDDHILETIRDAAGRQDLISQMQAHTVPAAAPHFTALGG